MQDSRREATSGDNLAAEDVLNSNHQHMMATMQHSKIGSASSMHTQECRTESTLKGIKQEPLNVTPYNGKTEYCRIIPS